MVIQLQIGRMAVIKSISFRLSTSRSWFAVFIYWHLIIIDETDRLSFDYGSTDPCHPIKHNNITALQQTSWWKLSSIDGFIDFILKKERKPVKVEVELNQIQLKIQ